MPIRVDDKALIEALQDATSFVLVEHEDAEEQFDEEGTPLLTPDSDEVVDNFLARSPSSVTLGKEFVVALGRLFLGK